MLIFLPFTLLAHYHKWKQRISGLSCRFGVESLRQRRPPAAGFVATVLHCYPLLPYQRLGVTLLPLVLAEDEDWYRKV